LCVCVFCVSSEEYNMVRYHMVLYLNLGMGTQYWFLQ